MAEKKKVLATFPFDPHIIPQYDEIQAEFEQHGFQVTVDPRLRKLTFDELVEALQGCYAHVVAGERITREVMAACPTVKQFARMGAGVDTVDIDAATKAGVVITNTPGANAETVAEHTIAMMLALTRGIVYLDTTMRQGIFQNYFGHALLRSTVGLIGFGHIGKNVAKMLAGFDCRVLVFDKYTQSQELAEQCHVEFCSLETLLRESDFISIHAPLTAETANMIGKREFGWMKPTVQLINCARGGIIDEQALVDALREHRILGAALDAYSEEPLPMEHPLYTLPNVILSPHTAGMTYEGRGKVVKMAFQNIADQAEGKIPYGIINREVWTKRGESK